MSRRVSLSEVNIDVAEGRATTAEAAEPDTPFRIAILGDFSGRASRGVCEPLADRRAVLVDRDNFDAVLAKCGCELKLSLAGSQDSSVTLRFAELDDFHPDRIFENVELFRRLRQARQKLADPKTFAATARELGIMPASAATPAESRPAAAAHPPAPPDPSSLVSGSLLDQTVEQTEAGPAEPRRSRPDELMSFARRAVEPYLVPGADPRQSEVVARVDDAISDAMRALLHYPGFQALEAAWRAVDLLARRLETGSQLKVYLIDVSKAELVRDLLATDDLSVSGAYKLLVDKTVGTPGAETWSVLVGNYSFEGAIEDMELLRRLALIGAAARAPWLAAASPKLLGCESLSATPEPRDWRPQAASEGFQAWRMVRRLPEARWVGLALPRFLLRLPYGKDTESTERFEFEEMPGVPAHEGYLWGNSAFACALLLARAFSDDGWDLHPGSQSEVGELPLHVYKVNSESEAKPCAEVLLTTEAVECVLEAGIMPLVSFKNRDVVRLARFQSVADPPAALRGRWG